MTNCSLGSVISMLLTSEISEAIAGTGEWKDGRNAAERC
jgi:hypothetical protein